LFLVNQQIKKTTVKGENYQAAGNIVADIVQIVLFLQGQNPPVSTTKAVGAVAVDIDRR